MWRRVGVVACTTVLGAAALATAAGASRAAVTGSSSFLHRLGAISKVGSTVPADGDVNPYGVAVVPESLGRLVAGDVLVSNFNSKANVQGTGATIVQLSRTGHEQLFSQIARLPAGNACPGGVGLTTALAALPGGWVVVGSLPSGPGGALPTQLTPGCLIVLDDQGNVAETFSSPSIDGPWDMVAQPTTGGADLFFADALGGNTKTTAGGVPVAGNCSIVRMDLGISSATAPVLLSTTVIGSDYPWKANKAALVLAPTGVALSPSGTLFVDNTLTNTVSAVPDAVTRTTALAQGSTVIAKGGALNAPLGMVLAPNGDLVVVNGNNGVATELNERGKQVATRTLVKNGAGDLFGLAVTPDAQGLYFVNDGENTLELAQHRSG